MHISASPTPTGPAPAPIGRRDRWDSATADLDYDHKTLAAQRLGHTVSLSITFRDERETPPRRLDSVQSVFDEIVIVDTGSTDGTFGVKVNDAEQPNRC